MFKSKWRKYLENTLENLSNNEKSIIETQKSMIEAQKSIIEMQKLMMETQKLMMETQKRIIDNEQQLFGELKFLKESGEWLQKSTNNVYEQVKTLDGCINVVFNYVSTIHDSLEYYYYHPNRDTISNSQYSNLEYVSHYLTCSNKKPKILISGFYGAYNLGDELMLQTLLSYIPKEMYSCVTVLLYRDDMYNHLSLPAVNFLHYPKNGFDYDFLAKEFDLLIWGGGALIDDTYYDLGHTNLLGNMFADMSERFLSYKKKVIGIGLSSSKDLVNLKYIKKLSQIIPSFEYFSVRDKYSAELLNRKGISNVAVNADIVFGDKYWQKAISSSDDQEIKTVGLACVCLEETKELIKKIFDIITQKYGKDCKIKCIPFFDSGNIDTVIYKELKELYGNDERIIVCEYKNTIEEVCQEILSVDIMVNMRYHAMVLSSVLGKKSFNISYDHSPHYYNKVRNIMEQFDTVENMVSYDSFVNGSFSEWGVLKKPAVRQDLYEAVSAEIKTVFENYLR